MKASETKLQPIIEGTKQYIVPLFQRSYSWEREEWNVLWEDLVDLCSMDTPRTHFVGSIVTMPTMSVPEGVAKYLLIDGQQRLTTIFIILALLRDKAKENDQKELAEEINNTLLVNPYKKDMDYYKLQPTQGDRLSFHNIIHALPIEAKDKITNAYQFFERKIRQSHIDGQLLKKIISNNLSTVSIVLDPDDNPHLVFESLNAKGRPLSQSDLIRNYFFMRIHVNEQDSIYNELWKPMQDSLGESLTECIRHYLMKSGPIVKQSEVYFSLKELVIRGEAIDYLTDLARFAKYYEILLYPEKEPNVLIQQALKRLNRLEVTTAYPFLLNCYHDYIQNIISIDEFVRSLKIIENFMIRRFVCNIPTMGLNKMFPALYSQVQNNNLGNFVEAMKKVLQTKGYPKDIEFRSRLMDASLYSRGERVTRTKLILESIEEFYSHKEQVPFHKLSIEHLMPQTLTEYWQNHLGEDWEITHDLLLHTLGNLTLTAYNSELSNDDFESKKIRLGKSHLEINEYFANKPSWKRKDIEERAAYLSDIAAKIWPYFGDEESDQDEPTTVTGTTPKALWILGQEFIVESWRDVLEQTMNTIAELEPEKFEEIIHQFPRFVGRDKKGFRAIRELKNGAFIEVHLSAQSIQRFCFQALQSIELASTDWKVDKV